MNEREPPAPPEGLFEGSNRALDAAWDWARKAGAGVGSFVDKQKRITWCDRAIRELEEDRRELLLALGEDLCKAVVERRVEGGRWALPDDVVDRCRQVEDLDTKIEAQKLVRSRLADEGKRRPTGRRGPREA